MLSLAHWCRRLIGIFEPIAVMHNLTLARNRWDPLQREHPRHSAVQAKTISRKVTCNSKGGEHGLSDENQVAPKFPSDCLPPHSRPPTRSLLTLNHPQLPLEPHNGKSAAGLSHPSHHGGLSTRNDTRAADVRF